MANPLQKAPQFLMDLFRLRTTGHQPIEFGELVLPIVDVGVMYGADLQATSTTNSAAGALPRNVIATIGTSSRYLGIAGSWTVGAAAGTQAQLTVGVALPTVNAAFFPLFSTLIVTPQATRTYFVGGILPYPLTLPAGAAILMRAFGDAAGADHVASLSLYLEDPLRS
jgi:hypothetical protein